jgi:subtilisin family serine protease
MGKGFFYAQKLLSCSNKLMIMKFILVFFMTLLTTVGFSQKQAVGVLVKFVDGLSFEAKATVINAVKIAKPLNQLQDLNGFDVTLVELAEGLDEENCLELANELEKSELVSFTSIIYKTNQGAIGADLQELYVKPKGAFDPKPLLASEACVSVALHHYLADVYVYTFDKKSTDIRTVQAELQSSGKFEFVSVNTLHTVLATVDDPYFENQWALENNGTPIHFDGVDGADMSVVEAWTISTGNPAIKVAVLDSGTDTNHVDLVGNLLPGYDATGGGSLGYPNLTYDNDAHGTCTAGIVGAMGNNGIGTAGVAYSCKVIPVKIFYYVPFGGDVVPFTSTEAGTNGIIWAVNTAKADILSNSWGLRASDIILLGLDTVMSNLIISENIHNGREGKGTPMLFSTGNDYDNYAIWPASNPITIGVGASSMCDEIKSPTDCSPEGWWGSNYGENLDVTAPGVKVLTTDLSGSLGYDDFVDEDYSMFNGTSAACPNAAGVMALILSVAPDLGFNDARAILSITADKTGGYDYDSENTYGMWSTEMGYGRVNAFEAVTYASSYTNVSSISPSSHDYISYFNGSTLLTIADLATSEVIIYSLLGAEILRIPAGEMSSNVINLNELTQSAGMYLVKISNQAYEVTLKAIIQ